MEENKKTNDFFGACLRELNEGVKIFDDDFVNKIMEKVPFNKDSNAYFKKETWENGNLVDKVEKRWEDGKVVFPEEPKNNKLFQGECSCSKDKKCDECHNFSTTSALKELEDKYVAKLQVVNTEVDKLKASVNHMTEENKRLAKENSVLKKKISDMKSDLGLLFNNI